MDFDFINYLSSTKLKMNCFLNNNDMKKALFNCSYIENNCKFSTNFYETYELSKEFFNGKGLEFFKEILKISTVNSLFTLIIKQSVIVWTNEKNVNDRLFVYDPNLLMKANEITTQNDPDIITRKYLEILSYSNKLMNDCDNKQYIKFILVDLFRVSRNICISFTKFYDSVLKSVKILFNTIEEIKLSIQSKTLIEKRLTNILRNQERIIKLYKLFDFDEMNNYITKYNENIINLNHRKKEESKNRFIEDCENSIIKNRREEKIKAYNDNKKQKSFRYVDEENIMTYEQKDAINDYVNIINSIKEEETDINIAIDLLPINLFSDEVSMIKEVVKKLREYNTNHFVNELLIVLNNKLKKNACKVKQKRTC